MASVQFVDDLRSQVSQLLNAFPIAETHSCLDDFDEGDSARIPVHKY